MNIVRIFNPKTSNEILIDVSSEMVIFHPKAYEEKPYFEIKLLNGFNFIKHTKVCDDCQSLFNCLGTQTVDWYLEFNSSAYRLDLSNLGDETKLKFINSEYEFGTVMKLIVSEIPVDKESLIILRDNLLLEQSYEKACVIRDLINEK
jgi:hypothetical protein